MSYAGLSDLIAAFGTDDLIALTDRADPPADAIDEVAVTDALAGAQSLIDGYLASRYATPLATVPDIVRRWACDIARHRLYLNRGGPTEPVQKAYDDTLRQMRDAADGRLTLAVAGVAAAGAPGGGGVKGVIPPRIFDARALEGFR
jgi:phage gp36-like protein